MVLKTGDSVGIVGCSNARFLSIANTIEAGHGIDSKCIAIGKLMSLRKIY